MGYLIFAKFHTISLLDGLNLKFVRRMDKTTSIGAVGKGVQVRSCSNIRILLTHFQLRKFKSSEAV